MLVRKKSSEVGMEGPRKRRKKKLKNDLFTEIIILYSNDLELKNKGLKYIFLISSIHNFQFKVLNKTNLGKKGYGMPKIEEKNAK